MAIADHVSDLQIFERYAVVTDNQRVGLLVQVVLAPVGYALVLAPKSRYRLTPVARAQLPARDTALQDAQPGLLGPIPRLIGNRLAILSGQQVVDPHIDADVLPSWRQRLTLDFAAKADVPLPGLANETQGFGDYSAA